MKIIFFIFLATFCYKPGSCDLILDGRPDYIGNDILSYGDCTGPGHRGFSDYCRFYPINNVSVTERASEPYLSEDQQTDYDVCNVQFFGGTLHHIPQKLFKTFPSIEVIEIESTKIHQIKKGFIENAKNLKTFTCLKSTLKSLGEEAFAGTKVLKNINLDGNKIEEVHKGAFKGLGDLINLSLNDNNLKKIDAEWFQDLAKLEKLSLGHNKITAIESYVFHGAPNIGEVWMNRNLIEIIHVEAFSGSLSLNLLSLSGNKLRNIPANLFVRNNLQFLGLTGNLCVDKMFRCESMSAIKIGLEACQQIAPKTYKKSFNPLQTDTETITQQNNKNSEVSERDVMISMFRKLWNWMKKLIS